MRYLNVRTIAAMAMIQAAQDRCAHEWKPPAPDPLNNGDITKTCTQCGKVERVTMRQVAKA